MKFVIVIFSIVLMVTVSSAKVEMRQRHAHTHGSAQLNIALEQDGINAYLDIAGMDLMGFEGKAKTDEQKKNLKTVTDLLTKDYNMFIINEAAGCMVIKRDLRNDSNKDKDHSGYKYNIKYKCKDLSKVTELEVNLFRDLESLKELTVHVITDTVQKETKLSPTDSKIKL